MTKRIEHEQITVRVPKADIARSERLTGSLAPFTAIRADILRMAIHLGLAELEKMAKRNAKAFASARKLIE